MAREERIASLILAAGRSRRMGAFKPLLPFGGRSILEAIVELHRSSGVTEILVVLGHRATEVRSVLEPLQVDSILNETFDRGMFSSLQCGARRLAPLCDAFFLHPVDVPLVRPATLRALMDAHRDGGALVYRPLHEGRGGHPPLISAALIPEVLAFAEPGGMRALLSRRRGDVFDVECGDPGVLVDVDTPAVYATALREHALGAAPRASRR